MPPIDAPSHRPLRANAATPVNVTDRSRIRFKQSLWAKKTHPDKCAVLDFRAL